MPIKNTTKQKISKARSDAKNILMKLIVPHLCISKIKIFEAFYSVIL